MRRDRVAALSVTDGARQAWLAPVTLGRCTRCHLGTRPKVAGVPVVRVGVVTRSTATVPPRKPVAKMGHRCDNRHVPVEGHLYGERVWFHDVRGHVRRMGVSTHPADSTIVISLWQGDICTGTFRLPAKDAAGLISTLAYGMAEAIPGQRPDSDLAPSRLGLIWSRFFRRVFVRSPGPTETRLRLLK